MACAIWRTASISARPAPLPRASRHREQVLQVADVPGVPGRAMDHPVHDAEHRAVALGDEAAHRLGTAGQPREGRVGDVRRNRGFVKRQIALPERLPGGAV